MKILWFREDIRLTDNPAFHALEGEEGVLCLYIYDTGASRPLGAASKWWLHHALASLDADLRARGGVLTLMKGDALKVMTAFAQKHGAKAVHMNRVYDAYGIARDVALESELERAGVMVRSFNGSLLHDPDDIRNKSGTPFKVFTPFKNAVVALPKREVLPVPHLTYAHGYESLSLSDLDLLPHISWEEGLKAMWGVPCEADAHTRLSDFLRDDVARYKSERDIPAVPATSRLSPYLRFGQISPIAVWHATHAHIAEHSRERESAEHFLSEVCWREFSYHLLSTHPDLATQPLRTEFARFPWKEDDARFKAWTKGKTGVPIVDAGMRELWATGYMHNRVRMIVASYLIKNLGIPWQQGEEWFWDTLVDADPANNAASWQWVAGCGADAAPFFRIFNPVTQSEKFDPEGVYIKKWVPELFKLSGHDLFAPWDADWEVLAQAGVILGTTYPHPLVDLKESREAALSAYKSLRDG